MKTSKKGFELATEEPKKVDITNFKLVTKNWGWEPKPKTIAENVLKSSNIWRLLAWKITQINQNATILQKVKFEWRHQMSIFSWMRSNIARLTLRFATLGKAFLRKKRTLSLTLLSPTHVLSKQHYVRIEHNKRMDQLAWGGSKLYRSYPLVFPRLCKNKFWVRKDG